MNPDTNLPPDEIEATPSEGWQLEHLRTLKMWLIDLAIIAAIIVAGIVLGG